MQGKSKIYQRRSIRLKNYDYSKTGLYFISICTWNHLHGIIEIINCHDTYRRGTAHRAQFAKPISNTIPTIIRSYKSAVTKQIREQSHNRNFKIWQRNYYEHIIRNEESYLKISEYIVNNPLKWREDKYYG